MQSISETTRAWAEQRQIDIVYTQETGSTNDDAKKKALQESAKAVLYLTAHQTAGRGRGANTWLDTGSGECLLSTWSYHMPTSPQSITAPRIGLAIFNAVSSTWPSLAWSLKAPNDIFLNGLKVGGILVESVSSGQNFRMIVGFGFNVLNHPRRFKEADHLGQELHGAPDEGEWFQFLDELKREFEAALPEVQKATLSEPTCRELTRALNANANKPFTVTAVTAQGDLVHAGGKVPWTQI